MRTRSACICMAVFLFFLQACKENKDKYTIDLSGTWEFQIDSLDQGIADHWETKAYGDRIQLPGSMLTNGKGNAITAGTKWTAGIWDSTWYKSPEFARYRQPGNIKISFFLQPLTHYVGVAWYRIKINVPEGWKERNTELFLERCHWESTVWVDEQKAGMQNALSAPHIYDLSPWLTPGDHNLTIRIDNRIKDIDPGRDAHSLTDNTQTNWNGIIGRMCLISRPLIYISRIQIYPDVDNKRIRAKIEISNTSGREADCRLALSAALANAVSKILPVPLSQPIHIKKDTTVVDLFFPMGDDPLLWDEFEPNIYTLKTEIKGKGVRDLCLTDFGMRKFEIRDTRFWINGRPVFLRGTLECAIFPKTGDRKSVV
jgi:beta-galactosidase/beta-glucuronidase